MKKYNKHNVRVGRTFYVIELRYTDELVDKRFPIIGNTICGVVNSYRVTNKPTKNDGNDGVVSRKLAINAYHEFKYFSKKKATKMMNDQVRFMNSKLRV